MKKEDIKFFLKIPSVKGERIVLRQITPKDLYDVNEYATDPAVSQYLLWRPHPDLTYTKHYLNYISGLYKKGKFYDWGIELEGKMIGTCGFTSFDIENNSAQIGYVLNSKYWYRGIGREAVTLLLKIGFEILSLQRIEARFISENINSRKVAEKCGMTMEGTLRNAIICKGSYKNVGICAITKDEYFKKTSV